MLPDNSETICDHPQLKRRKHGHERVSLYGDPWEFQISAISKPKLMFCSKLKLKGIKVNRPPTFLYYIYFFSKNTSRIT